MAFISAEEPLLSTVSPSILREDVAEDEDEDGDRSSLSSFASVSSTPPVDQAGVAIVLEGKSFERMHEAFFWLVIGVVVVILLGLAGF